MRSRAPPDRETVPLPDQTPASPANGVCAIHRCASAPTTAHCKRKMTAMMPEKRRGVSLRGRLLCAGVRPVRERTSCDAVTTVILVSQERSCRRYQIMIAKLGMSDLTDQDRKRQIWTGYLEKRRLLQRTRRQGSRLCNFIDI